MWLAEEILCSIGLLSWAGLPKSRARDRTWVQVVYLKGDARKQRAGFGETEIGIQRSQNKGHCQSHCREQWGNEWGGQLLWDSIRSLEWSPEGLEATEHLPACPWALLVRVAPRGIHSPEVLSCT